MRTLLPWYWRALMLAAALALAFALGGWVYDNAGRYAGLPGDPAEEVQALRRRVSDLEQSLAQFRGESQAADSTLQIERAAQQQLAQQIRLLEAENARLRQDLAVFESLAAADEANANLEISDLRVEPEEVQGRYRYRMLVAMRGARKDQREFRGELQLLIHLQRQGKAVMMTLPAAGDATRDQFQLNFRHFQRISGEFQIPEGASVSSVEARLLQGGETRAAKTVNVG